MHPGFNRYMVECELSCCLLSCASRRCFNRYMVECEFSIGFFCDNKSDGFNRYMVECEYNSIFYILTIICVLIDTWWNVNSL